MPYQIVVCTQLTRLEMSYNYMDLDHTDAEMFTGQHQLKIIGLRRLEGDAWHGHDVEAVAGIQRNCTRIDGSGPTIVCWRDMTEPHEELDAETDFIEPDQKYD